MLRLTLTTHNDDASVLQVDGRVAGDAVTLLEEEGRRWLQQGRRLILDLSGVRTIDPEAVELLKRWTGDGVRLSGASPFIEQLLLAHGLSLADPGASQPRRET